MSTVSRIVAAVLACTCALTLSACEDKRVVVGKLIIGNQYVIQCRTGFKDTAKGKEAVIVRQVVSQKKYQSTNNGDAC